MTCLLVSSVKLEIDHLVILLFSIIGRNISYKSNLTSMGTYYDDNNFFMVEVIREEVKVNFIFLKKYYIFIIYICRVEGVNLNG